MARIVLFASIREELGSEVLDVVLPEDTPLSKLIRALAQERGENWQTVLTAENVRVAVNQELIIGDVTVSDTDEIAFFPPVTGG